MKIAGRNWDNEASQLNNYKRYATLLWSFLDVFIRKCNIYQRKRDSKTQTKWVSGPVGSGGGGLTCWEWLGGLTLVVGGRPPVSCASSGCRLTLFCGFSPLWAMLTPRGAWYTEVNVLSLETSFIYPSSFPNTTRCPKVFQIVTM